MFTFCKQTADSLFFLSCLGFLPLNDWESEEYFDPAWLEFMNKHQPFMPQKTINKRRVWVYYIIDEADKTNSTFRCRLCHENYDALKLDIRYKPNLADARPKIESVMNKNTRAIQNFINHHARGNSHMTVFQEITKRANQIVFL